MGRFDGKVALISGGARGQGAAEAKLLAREGAKVVFGDILDDEGRQVEAEIRAAGGQATYMHLDVTSEAAWRVAVETAESTYGKLDILVNNAGINLPGRIDDYTEDDWERTMAVNMKGTFMGVKHAIPAMRRVADRSSIFCREWASRRRREPRAPTRRARAAYGFLPNRRRCNTQLRTFAATQCILVPSIPR